MMKNLRLLLYCIDIFLVIIFQKCQGYPLHNNFKIFLETNGLTQINVSVMTQQENQSFHLGLNFESKVEYSKPSSSGICLTPECRDTASQILEYMDQSVEPCDNFYNFACGNFIRSAIIPENKSNLDLFIMVNEKIYEQLKTIIEEKKPTDDSKLLTFEKRFYKLCMNSTAETEQKSIKKLLDDLKVLGGWPVLEGKLWKQEAFDWIKSAYTSRKMGYNFHSIISFGIETDSKNQTNQLLKISSPDLGLSESQLLHNLTDKVVNAYYSYMVDIAVILGANRTTAKEQLLESLKFEKQLANISLLDEETENPTAIALKELEMNYPVIPWMDYINTMLKPYTTLVEEEKVYVDSPIYLQELKKLMQHTPKRTVANYIMWSTVSKVAEFLSAEIRERQQKFHAVLQIETEKTPKWMQCINKVLTKAFDSVYVTKYANEKSKKSVIEMTHNIRQEFKKILQTADWLDEKTRKYALEKAEDMMYSVGYPDELLDETQFKNTDNVEKLNTFNTFELYLYKTRLGVDNNFKEFRKLPNISDWKYNYVSPVTAMTFYMKTNRIEIPAAILQDNFFNDTKPNYMNYGRIGWLIGHEITHGFDDDGRQYDKKGNFKEWWEPESKKKFLEKAQCITSQYGNYTVKEVELKINGTNTLGENISDHGGLKIAYNAYQEWVKKNGPEPRLPGLNYSPLQFFWISAAQLWCEKISPQALKETIMSDEHSPSEFRVLGTFSNRPEFSKDFNCAVGTKMNPKMKCSLW